MVSGYRVNDGHPYNRDTQEVREVLIGDKENGEAEDVKSTTNVESTSKEVHSDVFDTSTKTPASAAPRNPAGHVPPSDEAPTTTTLTFQQPQEKSSLIGSETVDCENDREKEEEELTRLITAAQQSFVDTDGHFVELSASMPSPSGRLDSHALPAGLSVAPVSGFHDKHLVRKKCPSFEMRTDWDVFVPLPGILIFPKRSLYMKFQTSITIDKIIRV
jgi:hypothetical protein